MNWATPISDEHVPSFCFYHCAHRAHWFPAFVQCKDGGCSKMLKLHDGDWEAISGFGWHA